LGSYVVLGSYPAGAESNDKLQLDSSLGGPFINAAGGTRTLQRSILPTSADPATGEGLKWGVHTFSVFGLFDLTIPPLPRDGYGIAVNDGGPSAPPSRSTSLSGAKRTGISGSGFRSRTSRAR
jgi:hypothetical protein